MSSSSFSGKTPLQAILWLGYKNLKYTDLYFYYGKDLGFIFLHQTLFVPEVFKFIGLGNASTLDSVTILNTISDAALMTYNSVVSIQTSPVN